MCVYIQHSGVRGINPYRKVMGDEICVLFYIFFGICGSYFSYFEKSGGDVSPHPPWICAPVYINWNYTLSNFAANL